MVWWADVGGSFFIRLFEHALRAGPVVGPSRAVEVSSRNSVELLPG